MSDNVSLAPGFSPVVADVDGENRFNGFPRAGQRKNRSREAIERFEDLTIC